MTDQRTCDHCGKHLITHRRGARFCGDECKNTWHNKHRRSQSTPGKRFGPTEGGAGSRGGNVRSVDEARQLQTASKALDRWRLVMELQIHRTLLETGHFHVDDLDCLELPPEAFEVRGTLVNAVRRTGVMRSTNVTRKVAHKAANARKAPIYEITPKGRKELPTLVGSSSGMPSGASPVAAAPSQDKTPVQLSGGSSGEVATAAQLGEEQEGIAGPATAAQRPGDGRSGESGESGVGHPEGKRGAVSSLPTVATDTCSPEDCTDVGQSRGKSDPGRCWSTSPAAGVGAPQLPGVEAGGVSQERKLVELAPRGTGHGPGKIPSAYDPFEGEAA